MYSSKKDKLNTDLLKVELAKAKELGQAINADELTAFDKSNIEFVNQYKDAVEVAAFRNQMKRICELAGINYELENRAGGQSTINIKTNGIKAGTPIVIVPWWRTLKTSS